MSFLLDTDACSAHVKRPSGLTHRFTQHAGRLFLSTVALGELYAWAYQRSDPLPLLKSLRRDLLTDVSVLDFDAACAEAFGRVRGQLLRQGISVSRLDLMIASVALAHDLTLVTHNTAHFIHIPGLRLVDWLTPMSNHAQQVVQKLWNYCNLLRDDGRVAPRARRPPRQVAPHGRLRPVGRGRLPRLWVGARGVPERLPGQPDLRDRGRP